MTSTASTSSKAFALVVTALLGGCAVGPDFAVPATPDVDRYSKAPLVSRTSSSDAALGGAQHFNGGKDVSDRWWELFRSPALNSLVEASLQANPNLQSQLAALRSAKELVYAQKGKFFPTVQGGFGATRQQSPNNPLGSAPTGDDGNVINPFNVFTTQVSVSYVPDVWGLTRRGVESQQALADAQRFQMEAAYITLTSNVVVAAVQEASLRAQIAATQQIIDVNTKMVEILRRQFSTGYSTRSDLAVQEASLAQNKATLPPLRQQLAVQRDLLAALAGRFPSQEPTETFKLVSFRLPSDLPVSLPSRLVDQRPDVRAAEEQLHSSGALVGVAIANMLPNFTISGNRGYTSLELANLISPPNLMWSVGANAVHTIFDGFSLLHQQRAAQATFEQAAWSYRTTVVGALQNVADVLHALQNDADALKAARDFERAAKISFDLARQRMETGDANVLVLLTAQQTYLQALIQVAQAQASRLSDTAALYVALGGGWWNREGPPAPEQKFDTATATTQPLPSQEKQGFWPGFPSSDKF
ncbi:efflux transporter outer membrane subunit [Bradyrhizobium genosp. A]|uniref:efflux transporter outer membrane subunit n=1 Tax=Bradyrhizobium genosp. A TaxID=83626 RepID=UPI003CE72096